MMEKILLRYDDRKNLCQLLGLDAVQTVEITDQQVRSKQVGTNLADLAVLHYEQGVLYAVGTGSATLLVDGASYCVSVEAAPISLIMITGHSVGRGQEGNGEQSVPVEAGQAYTTHRYHTRTDTDSTDVIDPREITPTTGLGWRSANRITGLDSYAPGQCGQEGEGSALAWRWIQLTGEKIWVINAAVGGSCLHEWIPGIQGHNKVYHYLYDTSMAAYRNAQGVLKNEIAAGHYTLSHMGIIYHNAANFKQFPDYNDTLMREYYQIMWSGLKRDLTMDVDGDGRDETVEFMGLVPHRSNLSNEIYYKFDRPHSFMMGTLAQYPDMFSAADLTERFLSKADLQNFPEIIYPTQSQPVSPPVDMVSTAHGGCSDNSFFCYKDQVHLSQVVYNAQGIAVAENMYHYLYTQDAKISGNFRDVCNQPVASEITLPVGEAYTMVPRSTPLWYGGLTMEVSGDLRLEYPCYVIGTQAGSGTVTLKNKDQVLCTVHITVTE